MPAPNAKVGKKKSHSTQKNSLAGTRIEHMGNINNNDEILLSPAANMHPAGVAILSCCKIEKISKQREIWACNDWYSLCFGQEFVHIFPLQLYLVWNILEQGCEDWDLTGRK